MSPKAKAAGIVAIIIGAVAWSRRSASAATAPYPEPGPTPPAPPREPTSAPQPRPDMTGRADPEVQRIQFLLRQLGYDPGPIDGRMGPLTRNAIRDFQSASGYPATGVMDDATRARIDRAAENANIQTRSGQVYQAPPINVSESYDGGGGAKSTGEIGGRRVRRAVGNRYRY